MAAIKTTDGQYIVIPAERAVRWWQILNCEIQPASKEEAAKASRIERVMLNSKNPLTPASYLEAHPVEHEQKYYSRIGEAYS